jgi:hypothetical protein
MTMKAGKLSTSMRQIALLALSSLHVFLEFPLNSINLRQLGTIAAQAVMPKRQAQTNSAGSG